MGSCIIQSEEYSERKFGWKRTTLAACFMDWLPLKEKSWEKWARCDISKRIGLGHGGRQKRQKSLHLRGLHRQYVRDLLIFAICQKTC